MTKHSGTDLSVGSEHSPFCLFCISQLGGYPHTLFWRELGAMDATEAETYLDESEEPLFADDLDDDDDDIPAPPSPVNQDEIRRRVRLQAANNSSRAGENSLTFASTSPSWPDGQGGDSSAAVVDPSGTEQPVPIKKRKPILTLGPDRLAFLVFACYSLRGIAFYRLLLLLLLLLLSLCYCCFCSFAMYYCWCCYCCLPYCPAAAVVVVFHCIVFMLLSW